MRLKLLVKRHNLPDTAIVWAVDVSHDPTISQLLEQVSDVIPLESGGDWGLEDYAVEVKGSSGTSFECLHFQPLKTVLHEDDEVHIRPLLSQDVKLRRISGRHQITYDGRHLFDGFVFGKPRRQVPSDRPPVEIPPRKRRRITYDEEDADTSEEDALPTIEDKEADEDGNRQLVIRADFEDYDDDDDVEDDEDFAPDDDESEGDEMDEDAPEIDSDAISEENDYVDEEFGKEQFSDRDEVAENKEKLSTKAKVKILQEAFPTAPRAVCKHVVVGSTGSLGKAYETLSAGFKPAKPRKALGEFPGELGALTVKKTRSAVKSDAIKNKIPFEDSPEQNLDDDDDNDLISDDENPLLGYYDQHGLPPGSISTGSRPAKVGRISQGKGPTKIDLTKTVAAEAKISVSVGRAKSVRFSAGSGIVKPGDAIGADDEDDESDDEDFGADSSSDDDDNSSSSSDSSDEDEDDKSTDSSSSDESSDDSSSSSGSSSDSDSDSDEAPEETSSKVAPPTQKRSEEEKVEAASSKVKTPDVAPGKGAKSTKARNQRRKQTQVLKKMQEKGLIPTNITLTEFKQLDLNGVKSLDDATKALAAMRSASPTVEGSVSKSDPASSEFEIRRQQLLASLASGGVDIEMDTSSPKVKSSRSQTKIQEDAEITETVGQLAGGSPKRSIDNEQVRDNSTNTENFALVLGTTATPATSTADASPDSSTRPRSRLNLGAGRRLLFGALGIKTPKSKAEEEKVRSDLMKYVRPVKTPVEESTMDKPQEEESEDPEAWREKIVLRAVECCYEGIELSEPPFPFIQRWDPQQQGSYNKRGGKGKKNQRNQSQFYDTEPLPKKKKRKNDQSTSDEYYDTFDQYYEPASDQHNVDGEATNIMPVNSGSADAEINDQIMRDANGAITATSQTDLDDLPPLPENISSLSNLSSDQIKTGSVVAFKQLIMSEATKWQPEMSKYRTAVVIQISKNGDLELTLAKRDRAETERYYDEETGERIYGKFDMPDEDGDEDEELEDDGFLSVSFAELVEPKMVQQAPQAAELSPGASSNDKTNASTDDSVTLGHDDQSGSPQKSIEVPIIHDKNIDDLNQEGMPGGRASVAQRKDLIADNNEIMTTSIAEEDRHEISEIIRDAGFRSTIPSSVLRAKPQYPETPADYSQISQDESILDITEYDQMYNGYSPRFNGLDSTPPDLSTPTKLASSYQERSESISPDTHEPYVDLASAHYPKLSVPSSIASQVTDHGRQPDFPTPGDETIERVDDLNSFLESQEGVEGSREDINKLPPSQPDGDTGQATPRGRGLSLVSVSSSEALPSLTKFFSTQDLIKKEDAKTKAKPVKLFKEIPEEVDSDDEAMAKLDAQIDGSNDIDPIDMDMDITPKASQSQRRETQNEPKSEFKIPPGSQKVDLTLSSSPPQRRTRAASKKPELVETDPPLEEDDEGHDDSFGLPRGPGWVQKKRRTTSAGSRPSSQAKSQSQKRSTRRKTNWT